MEFSAEALYEWFMGFSLALLIIGGLAWGIVGAIDINIVTEITQLLPIEAGTSELLERIIYVLVGLAAAGRGIGWFNELPDDL